MPTVFDVLSRDHEEVKRMLAELETGPSAASGASGDELRQRKKMAERLVIEESGHEAVEEMYFWPEVRQRVADGDRLAAEATRQEQEGKEVLGKLGKLQAGDAGFEQVLGQFIQDGREHIAFEENQVWPALRAALTAEEASELGARLAAARERAPTRPHPNTLPVPGVLKATGPITGAADRARDAATGRGR